MLNVLATGDVKVKVNGKTWTYNSQCLEPAPEETPPGVCCCCFVLFLLLLLFCFVCFLFVFVLFICVCLCCVMGGRCTLHILNKNAYINE